MQTRFTERDPLGPCRERSPDYFGNDIIGQDPAVGIFRNAITAKRLGHSYLFTGPEGVGKFHFALALAKTLLCQCAGVSPAGEPVNRTTGAPSVRVCQSCRWVDQKNHPSLRILDVPEGKQSIPIDTIREIESEFALKPFMPGYRIFIFNNADKMESEAANALLKFLEEPVRDCIIILVTAHPESILPTVISRCQTIHFYPLQQAAIEKFFRKHLNLTEADARLLGYLSEGSIGNGIRINSDKLLEQRNWLIDNLAGENSPEDLASGLLNYAKSGNTSGEKTRERLIQQFKIIGLFLRDVLLTHHLKDTGLLNPDKTAEIKRWQKRATPNSAQHAIGELLAGEQYIKLNANINLVTEYTMLNIFRLLKV